ncbi:hypothetical protein BT93_B0056 [Corymbia citriodora subsp. variegata]|nr:hypothetical protein BT93_B0056 [Corymbia citriodora subsp. variegata]
MSDYIHPCSSQAVPTVTAEEFAAEFNQLAIEVYRPEMNDAMDDRILDSTVSIHESTVSADQSDAASLLFIGSELTQLHEGDQVHRYIKERFVSRLAKLGAHVNVVEIHQNRSSSFLAKARAQAFQLYSEAVQNKGGSDTANVRYAWYATSKGEVPKIFSYGFNSIKKPEGNGFYGCGVHFAPLNHPLDSIMTAPVDEDGLQHMLICRVILGKSELVSLGSKQSHPSSEQYDSGVDHLSSPRKYIVWSTYMNTHVLPKYVVSFRATYYIKGPLRTPKKSWNPNAPWIPFRFFITEFSKSFPSADANLVSKYYKAYKGGKIPRQALVQQVRQITGDRWLIGILKSFRAKVWTIIPLIDSPKALLCLDV